MALNRSMKTQAIMILVLGNFVVEAQKLLYFLHITKNWQNMLFRIVRASIGMPLMS